jgi:hypothetical protein
VGKYEGKGPLGRLRGWWSSINVGFKEMRQEGVGNLHTDMRMTLGNTYKCHECVDQQSNY